MTASRAALAALLLPLLPLGAGAAPGPKKIPVRATRMASPVLLTSILGLTAGMDRDEAEARLRPLGRMAGDADKDASPDKGGPPDKDRDTDKAAPAGGDPDAVPIEFWTLRGTPYARIAFAADDHDRLLWVTGFLRPGHETPFTSIGDTARAAGQSADRVVWNVISRHGSYRVRAAGKGGKAMTVSLVAIRPVSPNGIFSPQVVPPSLQGKHK